MRDFTTTVIKDVQIDAYQSHVVKTDYRQSDCSALGLFVYSVERRTIIVLMNERMRREFNKDISNVDHAILSHTGDPMIAELAYINKDGESLRTLIHADMIDFSCYNEFPRKMNLALWVCYPFACDNFLTVPCNIRRVKTRRFIKTWIVKTKVTC